MVTPDCDELELATHEVESLHGRLQIAQERLRRVRARVAGVFDAEIADLREDIPPAPVPKQNELRAKLAEARAELRHMRLTHEAERKLYAEERDEALAKLAEAEAKLEEREWEMHMRIRAGYDKTIADAWRAKVAEVEAQRDEHERRARRMQTTLDAAMRVLEAEREAWAKHEGAE